jgi:hypothetical protein
MWIDIEGCTADIDCAEPEILFFIFIFFGLSV